VINFKVERNSDDQVNQTRMEGSLIMIKNTMHYNRGKKNNVTLIDENEMGKQVLTVEELLKEIYAYSQQQFTGRLTVEIPQNLQWRFYFGMGRLLWASGGEHPRRRWRRQLVRACGQNTFSSYYSEQDLRSGDSYECWDFHLLLALHNRKKVSAEQVKMVMKGTIAEILFDLNRQGYALCRSVEAYPQEPNYYGKQVFTRKWTTKTRPSQQMVVPPSWGLEAEVSLRESQDSWYHWRGLDLTNISPNQAPRLVYREQLQAKTSPKVYNTLVKLVTGDHTLRDLSVLMNQETIKIARSLQGYIREDLIALEKVSDLLPPPASQKATPTKSENLQRRSGDEPTTTHYFLENTISTRSLVAFVDDSEQSRGIMANIITNGGYEFLGISDSVQAIPLLLERQPQLIFLDLIMPNINGYELCHQIRKISSLKDVPIVIVTGNDGIVDRMRAKVVGANKFISKPIDRSEVLTLALQYTQAGKS